MERTISLNLNNPFIMQIYGYNKKEEKIKYEIIEDSYIYHIYMELCDIDLHQFLVDNKETKHIDHIIIQIALGLQYLESNNLLHRDIKELNIILKDIAPELDINDGRRYRAKISDLDFLREIPSSNDKMTFVGTNGYMSPLTRDGKNDIKRDIYSFGIIIENLYKQKRLDERWKDIYKKLKDNDIKRRMTIKEFIEFIDNLNETKEEEIESLFYMVDKSFIDDSPLILLIIKEEIMKNKKFLNKFMPLFESLWEKFIGNILEEQVNDPLESLYLTSLKEVSRNILLLSKNDNGNQNLSLLSIDKARICLNYVLKRIEKESLKDDPEFIKSFGINVNRIEKGMFKFLFPINFILRIDF